MYDPTMELIDQLEVVRRGPNNSGYGAFIFSCMIQVKSLLVQIKKEREGEQIDRTLLKIGLDILADIGRGEIEY